MSRELLKHEKIFEFTTIWTDKMHDGKFDLSNTNKLIRFYPGANGLKTGSTSNAKCCISASAKRDDMQLIAVVICAPSSQDRFSSASALLDFGFANYEVAKDEDINVSVPYVRVVGGTTEQILPSVCGSGFILKKGNRDKLEQHFELTDSVSAPVEQGQKLGEVIYTIDGNEVARRDVCATEAVARIGVLQMFVRNLESWLILG